MPKYFCIDQGNTRTKWAILEDGVVILTSDERIALYEIMDLCEEHNVKGIGICTVTDEITRDSLGHQYPIVLIDQNTKIPFINAYSSPDSLGPDRLAAVAGAAAVYPTQPCLAITLGTCITYNFLTDGNIFRGGAISPGMYMRLQAMNQMTSSLPMVQPRRPLTLIGYDTESSLLNGAIFGMVDEIDGMIERYHSSFDNINVILTGGDAEFFASQLKNKIFADSNLIFKGIYAITDYNL